MTLLTTSYPLREGLISGIFVSHLARHLALTIEVTVLTPADTLSSMRTTCGHITLKPCRYSFKRLQTLAHTPGGIPVALKTDPWKFLLLPGLILSLFVNCVREARSSHIIHANWAICGCIAGVAGWMLRVPVVTTLRGEDVTRATTSALDRWILALCLRLSRRVICVSSEMLQWLERRCPDKKRKLLLIENGVMDSFGPERSSGANPAPQSTKVGLLAVGSLIPRKGVDQIIRAMTNVTDLPITLTIVGAGPEEDRLKDAVARADLTDRVNFTGAVAPELVADHLAQADIFVLASHGEGRPNVVLEAMSAALPIIASDIPGVRELVDHRQTGLLFPDGDVVGLARCIRTMASDPKLRYQFGQAGRRWIINHGLTWARCASRYIEAYRDAISGP